MGANLTVAHFTYTFAAGQIGILLCWAKLPQAKVVDVNMRNAALGASSTIALGCRKVNPASSLAASTAAAYLAATSTVSAATTRGSFAPIKKDEEVYVTATIAGGAVTGQSMDVTFFYVFENV